MTRWSAGQILLRTVIAAGPVLGAAASGLDGALPPSGLLMLVGVVSVAHALLPGSQLGTAALLLVLAWWGLGSVQVLSWSLLVAAAALLAAHVAALLVAYGPSDLPLDPGLVRTWLRRAVLSLLAAPLVWLVVAGVDDQPEPAGVWVAGLVAATVAAVVASVAFDIGDTG